MNKGLGKLILIAGLGLGALYFLKSDNKKVSNSEIKKETKEHPSLDKETIETIVKDHKEEKKEELKKVEYKNYDIELFFNNYGVDAFIRKKGDPMSVLDSTSGKDEQTALEYAKSMIDNGRVEYVKNSKGEYEKPKKKGRLTKEEFLAKMKAGREKKKMSKAEAGKLGGEATSDLGKHKGHKTKKGLVQDQNKVSKEEHEKHYQKGRFDKK